MKNIALYICDSDEVYLNRLNGYIQNQENCPFEVRTYTSPDVLDHTEDAKALLLIYSGLRSALIESENFFAKDWEGIVFLDEGKPERTSAEIFDGVFVDDISKYQSAKSVYEYLLRICADKGLLISGGLSKSSSSVRLFGVYSPQNKRLQGEFSLNLARQLAQKERGLYVSFEGLSPPEVSGKGLSEVILGIRETTQSRRSGIMLAAETQAAYGEAKFVLNVEAYVEQEGSLDILPPVSCPYDLWEIDESRWCFWIEQLMKAENYPFIVLNFGSVFPQLSLLDLCSKIYVPWQGSEEESCRNFKSVYHFMGKKEIVEKIEFVHQGGLA